MLEHAAGTSVGPQWGAFRVLEDHSSNQANGRAKRPSYPRGWDFIWSFWTALKFSYCSFLVIFHCSAKKNIPCLGPDLETHCQKKRLEGGSVERYLIYAGSDEPN